jgi:MarR family transcriptional regulator for hemolysin
VPEAGVKAASAPGPSDSREERLTELGQAFRRAYRSLRRLRGRDTHLLGGEISHAQFELLAELRDRGPLPAGELAQVAGLSAATVSQMLDHLADDGQVERVRSETDRRVVLIELTPLGRRRVEATKALWRARWEEALEGVDAKELQIASSVLQRIGAVFEEPPDS